MNNRILLVAAVAGLAIIIGIVGFSGQLIINDVSEGGIIQMSEHGSTGVKPLIMDLEELDISYVDEKFATLNLRFTVSNPNYKSVILQLQGRQSRCTYAFLPSAHTKSLALSLEISIPSSSSVDSSAPEFLACSM